MGSCGGDCFYQTRNAVSWYYSQSFLKQDAVDKTGETWWCTAKCIIKIRLKPVCPFLFAIQHLGTYGCDNFSNFKAPSTGHCLCPINYLLAIFYRNTTPLPVLIMNFFGQQPYATGVANFLTALKQLGAAEIFSAPVIYSACWKKNGVAYNIYTDPSGQTRPLGTGCHTANTQLMNGIPSMPGLHRAELLDLLLKDLWPGKHLIREGIIPQELILYMHLAQDSAAISRCPAKNILNAADTWHRGKIMGNQRPDTGASERRLRSETVLPCRVCSLNYLLTSR